MYYSDIVGSVQIVNKTIILGSSVKEGDIIYLQQAVQNSGANAEAPYLDFQIWGSGGLAYQYPLENSVQLQLDGGEFRIVHHQLELPELAEGTYRIYCELYRGIGDKTGSYSIDFSYLGETSLYDGCDLFEFKVTSTIHCQVNQDLQTVTGNVKGTFDLTQVTPTFTVSPSAVVMVSKVYQYSGESVIDLSSPVTYEVQAENGDSKEYVVTIHQTVSGEYDLLVINPTVDSKTFVTPLSVVAGQQLTLSAHILNDGTAGYNPQDGEFVQIQLWYDGSLVRDLAEAYIPINKPIAAGAREVFTKSWIVPNTLPYGAIGYHQIKFILGATINKQFTVLRAVPHITTLAYSVKNEAFVGERTYDTPFMMALNNDLYAVKNEDYSVRNKFYLMDYNGSQVLFDQPTPLTWSITFIVNSGPETVNFKNLDIEMGKILGGEARLEKIEYSTNRQMAFHDPFYTEDFSPWQPVWKDEKWHLPIMNEYEEGAIIEYKKLKGTFLRITFTGQNTDPIFLKNVMTKITKSFI